METISVRNVRLKISCFVIAFIEFKLHQSNVGFYKSITVVGQDEVKLDLAGNGG